MTQHISGRPTWAEINISNLTYNFQTVKEFLNVPVSYMAVVKADAYGHCAVECAKSLEVCGIDWFGVALPEEGFELRANGITKPILCLGSFWKDQETMLLLNNLTPVVYQIEQARLLDLAAEKLNLKPKIHIKIDTGMGRIGVRFDEVEVFAERIKQFKNLKFEGIMTHFAAADSFEEVEFTNLQISRFEESIRIFKNKGIDFLYNDLANSPASLAHPASYGNMIRLGGILYGFGGDVLPDWVERPKLKPVLALYSKIAFLKNVKKGETLGYSRTFRLQRDSLIASVPIGYQDGYKRSLSNRGRVIINGTYAPVVGRISMDWIIVDVTDVADAEIGNKVTLIGEENGLSITAEELAEKTGTISYEITCGIHRRVTRKYVES